MTTQETTLFRYRASESMTLMAAIAACQKALEGAIALLYSPERCTLARLASDGTLRDAGGEAFQGNRALDLTTVFEARLFNPVCELRWLNRLTGVGDAALITEAAQPSLTGFVAMDPQACEALSQRYLLWGELARSQPNVDSWQRLADARIGKLDIPMTQKFTQDQRVYLKTHEYLAPADNYGNMAVIEERLVKLEIA